MSNEDKEKMQSKNMIVKVVILVIVFTGAGFFGGIKYQQSKIPNFPTQFNRTGQRNSGSDGNTANEINSVRGKILSITDNSITVEEPNSSSKIVILNDNTKISKAEDGSISDLSEGLEVAIFGQSNTDGSVTAQSIQIGNDIFRNQSPN